MAITNLGAVGITAGGVYNSETVYKKYKVVSANGGSYMYINPTPAAGVPVTETSHWQQIASIGGQDLVDAAVAAKNTAVSAKDTAVAAAAQLAAGTASPAGTYADLDALIADDPDHSKIYITLDDGKWCYWNGSAWVAGGIYQAASVAQEMGNISDTIFNETYRRKTEVASAEYASGPARNVFFVPLSDMVVRNVETEFFCEELKGQTIYAVATNATKIGTIGSAIAYTVDADGYVTIIPTYDLGTSAAYIRVLCWDVTLETTSKIYVVDDDDGVITRLDKLDEETSSLLDKLDEETSSFSDLVYSVRDDINANTDKKIAQSRNDGVKLLFMSDIHLGVELQTSLAARFGYTDDERMDLLVEAVRAENNLGTIDMIFFLGDMVSNQAKKDSTTGKDEDFLPSFIAKMNGIQIPYFCAIGNHELYTDDMFETLLGYPSNYIVEIKNYAIVVFNLFGTENIVNPSSAGWTGNDITSDLKTSVLNYLSGTDKDNVIVCCHGFNGGIDYTNFNEVVADAKVIAVVYGHVHDLGPAINISGKPAFRDGHFSVGQGAAEPYWSYRIHKDDDGYKGNYAVQPSVTYTVDGADVDVERTEMYPNVWSDTYVDYGIKIIKM